MNFDEEMELALLEMNMNPAFLEKMMDDHADDAYSSSTSHASHQHTHQRSTGWWRKRLYRKKLLRRFLRLNPALKPSEMCGTHPHRAVYICSFKDAQYNPRHIYNINLYEKLYISPSGDIRLCKKRIVHHGGYDCYLIGVNDVPDAKNFTNRRIRSKMIREDDYASRSHALYKKQYSRMINNTI